MKSPGHREHPDHKVLESHLDKRVTVELNGELFADSRDVIQVEEDGSPPRFYFPRADVKMDKLSRTETTTQCPFKGTANYFAAVESGRKVADAVWTYEDPYEEHSALKGRLAFYDDKHPEIAIRALRGPDDD